MNPIITGHWKYYSILMVIPFFQTSLENHWIIDCDIFTFEAFINMMAKEY